MNPALRLLAVAASGAWTPASLPNLGGWWDPSNATTITATGNDLSQIDDLSGNARHLKWVSGQNKPLTGTVTQNGLNVIEFDGFARPLIADNFDVSLTGAGGVSFVGVVKWDSTSGTHGLFELKKSTTYDFYTFQLDRDTTNLRATYGFGAVSGFDSTKLNVQGFSDSNTTTAMVLSVKMSTAGMVVRMNGVAQTLSTLAGSAAASNFLSTLGAAQLKPLVGSRLGAEDNTSFSNHLDGKVGEHFFGTTYWSDADLGLAETYLKNKWGTP